LPEGAGAAAASAARTDEPEKDTAPR
jgi:hypothetical protein